MLFGQVVRAVSAGGRVMEYMDRQPSLSLRGGNKLNLSEIKGRVVFKDVTFSYPLRKDQVHIMTSHTHPPTPYTLPWYVTCDA